MHHGVGCWGVQPLDEVLRQLRCVGRCTRDVRGKGGWLCRLAPLSPASPLPRAFAGVPSWRSMRTPATCAPATHRTPGRRGPPARRHASGGGGAGGAGSCGVGGAGGDSGQSRQGHEQAVRVPRAAPRSPKGGSAQGPSVARSRRTLAPSAASSSVSCARRSGRTAHGGVLGDVVGRLLRRGPGDNAASSVAAFLVRRRARRPPHQPLSHRSEREHRRRNSGTGEPRREHQLLKKPGCSCQVAADRTHTLCAMRTRHKRGCRRKKPTASARAACDANASQALGRGPGVGAPAPALLLRTTLVEHPSLGKAP